jgi:hypothetical protein
MRRAEDDELFQPVRLQTWFRDGKERYWTVDENKPIAGVGACEFYSNFYSNRIDHFIIIGTSREDEAEAEAEESHNPEDDNNHTISPIQAEIEKWKEEAKERRLALLSQPTADELDPWMRYTGWNEVLGQSKHGLVKTHEFAQEASPEEPHLIRLCHAWEAILERCLNTLAHTDHKDTLKWWASPKNEVANPFPFELHQNKQSVSKCSQVWQQLICYIMRTAPEEWGNETGQFWNFIFPDQ